MEKKAKKKIVLIGAAIYGALICCLGSAPFICGREFLPFIPWMFPWSIICGAVTGKKIAQALIGKNIKDFRGAIGYGVASALPRATLCGALVGGGNGLAADLIFIKMGEVGVNPFTSIGIQLGAIGGVIFGLITGIITGPLVMKIFRKEVE